VQKQQKLIEGVAASSGFAPIARQDARVLILGSLPGQRSLRDHQYYAHPQNAFWRIMLALVGATGSYEERCASLRNQHIALWDVLAESVRPGSMDADIQLSSARCNDFAGFFADHNDIGLVCFNGQKASKLYQQFVGIDRNGPQCRFETLPSTSPAYAAMSYENKLTRWRDALS
jgi:hypoxanthine-DNA glycosylase